MELSLRTGLQLTSAIDAGSLKVASLEETSSRERRDLLKHAEWILGTLLSATVLFLLMVRATHAGALWRDECAVVHLARMPSISDILRNFQHEAFPPLFPLTIRAYTTLFGTSDTVFRIFGFCVGCMLIGAFWATSRLFRSGVPLVGLALLSLNTTFLVWGTTIRGYGLGSVLIVLAFGFVGRLLLVSNRAADIAAALVCLAAAQILLHNSVLVVAIAASAGAVLLCRRRLKRALVMSAVSAASILSILPYVPAYLQARSWNIVVRGTPTLNSLWNHLELAFGNPAHGIPALWYVTALGLTGLLIWRISKTQGSERLPQWDLIWFCVFVCGSSLIGYYAFLRVLSYLTSDWHYLALICVIAAALDLAAARLCTSDWLRWVRLGFGLAALIAAPFADWSAIIERQTNIDIVARTVAARAAPTDLIVVTPWQFGVTFQRYYRGPASWVTIPSIADHQVHRYDLVKIKMISTNPIDDLAKAVRATLVSGNRVWFVNGLTLPPPDEGPLILPPAPGSRFKWDNRAYTASWWQQLSVFVVLHAKRAVFSVALPVPESTRINYLEEAPLTVVQGWQ
jgi:hypothetical protein